MAVTSGGEATTYGPFLRFGGFFPDTKQWRASVLVVAHTTRCTTAPTLLLKDSQGGQDAKVTARKLDDFEGWGFWRFDIAVECGPAARTIEYIVNMPEGCEATLLKGPHKVALPGADQTWRVACYSCNGFHEAKLEKEAGGIQPLWRDMLACHQQSALHLVVGGGDQLYNDLVWECPSMKAWTKIASEVDRLKAEFNQEMSAQVNDYYVRSYLRHWSQPVFADALASIPQVMVWDDHDIWDGWGSYPDNLQNCPVFQGAYAVARRAYALFQLHTTPDTAVANNDVFGERGWHWITLMGPSTALLVMDSRSERSFNQVIAPNSWTMIKERLAALPATVKHVVALATVPMIYPKVPFMEGALHCIDTCVLRCGLPRNSLSPVELLQKTGLASDLVSQFGTVEILDDLTDHWGADSHREERKFFVNMMQNMSLSRGFRFSIVSGDVHLAAYGKFCSKDHREPRKDHRFIPQIITSAIANVPPPHDVVKTLTRFSAMSAFDEDTEEGMSGEVFGGKALLPERNWMLMTERTAAQGGALSFEFHCEHKHKVSRRHTIDKYTLDIPPLEGVSTASAPVSPELLQPKQVVITLPVIGPAAVSPAVPTAATPAAATA